MQLLAVVESEKKIDASFLTQSYVAKYPASLHVIFINVKVLNPSSLSFMDDFSTNRHSIKFEFAPSRHPDIWFSDGNIALVAGDFYFTVHQGVLCRHSELFAELIKKIKVEDSQTRLIDGLLVLMLNDQPKDLARFLIALYDGVYVPQSCCDVALLIWMTHSSDLKHDVKSFDTISSLLRLSTKYGVKHIRRDLLQGMSVVWPRTLGAWELRETEATDSSGLYKPRSVYPHPMSVHHPHFS